MCCERKATQQQAASQHFSPKEMLQAQQHSQCPLEGPQLSQAQGQLMPERDYWGQAAKFDFIVEVISRVVDVVHNVVDVVSRVGPGAAPRKNIAVLRLLLHDTLACGRSSAALRRPFQVA